MVQDRRALDLTALSLMVLLTALWGFQQVAIKTIAADVSPVMQAAIRSILASVLLLAWAQARGIALFQRDGTWWAGIAAGLLFAGEFVFIYAGLEHTNASRMVVFIYTTPPLTALGLHFFVRGERLVPGQWLGVLLAFTGLVVAFAEGFSSASGATFIGDLCGVIAAVLWASTTVLIRATRLSVLSFLAPMFGVIFGVLFLGEPLTAFFAAAALLVAAGIVLVNLRR